MKILFCEVRHFSPNFHKCTEVLPILSVYIFTGSKQYLPKKKSDFFSPKILEFFFLSKSVLGYYKTKKNKKK